jgi:hypothetical protein
MVYAAINPEKIQNDKGGKLMQVTLVLYWKISSFISKVHILFKFFGKGKLYLGSTNGPWVM